MSLVVRLVDEAAAREVLEVVHRAFGARPPLDPPTDALSETVQSVAHALHTHGGLLAELDGRPVGTLLFQSDGKVLRLRRFGVAPGAQGAGVAGALVDAALEHARTHAYAGVSVLARTDLPETVAFWQHHDFAIASRDGVMETMLLLFPQTVVTRTREETQAVAERLAPLLRKGDLLILSGDLGAGKTTFTQGLGRALGVRGEITSPTFVIARVHPPDRGDLPLVHVDAYRLGGVEELDDLDLDTSLEDAVTVVEWGDGLAEGLAADRLEIVLHRTVGEEPADGSEEHDPREIVIRPVGLRWVGVLT